MARGRKRPPSKMQQQAQRQGQQLLSDWATLTWIKDGTKLGPAPLVVVNWAVLIALGALLYFETVPRTWAGIALAAFLLYTFSRAGAVMPRRRKAVTAIYTAMQRPAALPRSTATTPVNPASYVSVANWGAKTRPGTFTLTVGPDSPATTAPYMRMPLEQAIQKATPPPEDGQEWIFDWGDSSHVTATAVPADDPRVWQRGHDRKMSRSLGDRALFDGARNAADYDYGLTVEERTESERGGVTYQFPTKVTWVYGGFDATDPQFRERVTADFDRKVRGPGVWVYDWSTDGELSIELVDDDDLRARRKIAARKITADVYSMIRTSKNSRIDCEVTKWMPEGKKLPEHYPVGVTIDFGTLNLGDRRVRNKFEEDFDTAMEASYQGLTWLYDWTPGGTTRLKATAYPSKSKQARRKATERNLRNVIETKFRGKEFVDCDVLEWQDELTESGRALPQVARVDFGSIDVSKMDTRDEFEDHWSSQTTECDWGFDWAEAGRVTITSAPRLPKTLAFPEVGTADWEERMRAFRSGKVYIGPTRGGGHFHWDMSKDPHSLVGGRTGSGKSVALDSVLNLAMTCRDEVDLVVCDPKRTDFTWVTEFPNVRMFAAGEIEICNAIGYLSEEMSRRQSLLNRRGVKNLGYLRRLYTEQPELEKEDGPAPKRLILIFDEIGNWWMRSADEDTEEAKGIARTQLEGLGQLARALEINMMFAAQKPDKDRMSTQLKEMCGFRLCVGPVDEYTSKQIIDSNHGTRFPAGDAPKGRAWAYSSSSGYFMVQVPYLPTRDEPCPWDPSFTLNGAIDRVREDLEKNGYQQITVPNADGGQEPRWVVLDDSDDAPTPGPDVDAATDAGSGDGEETLFDTGPEVESPAGQHEPTQETATSIPEPVEPEPAPQEHQDAEEAPAEPAAPPPSARAPRRASRAPGPSGGQQQSTENPSQAEDPDDVVDEDALWA